MIKNINNNISENLILPLSDAFTGLSVNKKLTFLLNSQWWSSEDIINYQEERLRNLIKHSVNSVPYYRELFKKNNLVINDIQKLEDLNKIPLLTKDTIKKEGQKKFLSTAIPKNTKLKSSSSGSTGEPLFYYTTKEAYSLKIAANLRGWYWMGFKLGDKYMKLSQNPRNTLIKKLQDYFSNNKYMSTNPLIESNYLHILNEIDKYKPDFIRCYPDPLLFLARYKKNNPFFHHIPKAITTTGNTLFPQVRREIEEAFQCEIFDSYSCEGNGNFFECSTHECYHSTDEYSISEVINPANQKINHGIGRLVSTDLWNYAHPFIRYETQDLVDIDNNNCSCNRKHFKVKRILGRNNEVLESITGRKFIVHNFTGYFQTDSKKLKRSINQFQVQKFKNKITFYLVVNNNFDASVENHIKNYWEHELGYEVLIDVVDKIPLNKNGKRKFIIDKSIE